MPNNQSAQITPKHIIAAVMFAVFVVVLFNLQTPSDGTGHVEIASPAQQPESQKLPRFSTTSIEAAKIAISKEPKVIELLYDEANAIEWHVAVADDGSRRYGYARYICNILSEAGAYDNDVAVRIVDAAKRSQFKDAYRDYSLGAVRCFDGQFLD